ncbi:MAG: phosphomannomutase, partial [Bdellovibrionaceae bacterium]|nr:phosphomannomutase [Pseudobdellovibrionaceae bacterium]
MYQPVIFREYDIRGVYNEQFDDAFAEELGRSYAVYLSERVGKGPHTISLGYDARLSSPAIIKALAKGLTESGVSVIHLGLVTTPVCYFSTFTLPEVSGAIMVTGSHNPPDYNGFKVSVGKTTIFGDDIQELRRIMESGRRLSGKGTERSHDIFPAYLARYREEFGTLKNVKVVLDCGNGAAGSIVRRLFKEVGLEPTILFEKPDGTFPNHHPDPTVEKNLVALRDAVLKEGAICGIG